MRSIVLCDLDSTIADTRKRHHMSPHNMDGKTWTDYAMACSSDDPMAGTVKLLNILLEAGYEIHIVSGRSAAAYDLTTEWLKQHCVPYHKLRLNAPEDIEDNVEFKLDYTRKLLASGHHVALFIDDWPPVAEAIHQQVGVPVVCVNPMYDDPPMQFFHDNPELSSKARLL